MNTKPNTPASRNEEAVTKTDREWFDFCRPFVYINGSHEMPNYAAICRAVLALAAPMDPMDWPLPCDVTVGHGTMRKGVPLRALVLRMKTLYEMATGNDADMIANRTPEERQALADKFLASVEGAHPREPLGKVIGNGYAAPGAAIDAGGQLSDAGIEAHLTAMLAKREFPDATPGATSYWLTPEEIRELFRRTALASRPEAPPASASPATVAQPVDRTVIGYTWTQANGKHRSVGAAPHPTNAHNIEPIHYPLAQPCASQGCALSHAQVEAAYTAWCHSRHPDPFVRMSTARRAALSTAKSVEHGATDGGTGE